MRQIASPEVTGVFASYPPKVRQRLLALRRLVLKTARSTKGVGPIEETLKWGEPAYVTAESKIGSTIRVHWKKSAPHEYAICFHCQTTLVDDFRSRFADTLKFDGNRRIVFGEDDQVPWEPLARCIAAALTYHRTTRTQRRTRR